MPLTDQRSSQSTFLLCGFMGCGKSSLGQALAKGLRYEFYDLDRFIEEQEKRKVSDIFENEGEQAFRVLEKQYLQELLNLKSNKVIALGGGTVCFFDNLEVIKDHGYLIYLRLPVKTLCQRLSQAKQDRPLLRNLQNQNLEAFVSELLEKRKTFYEKAHRIIDPLQTKPETLLNELRIMA